MKKLLVALLALALALAAPAFADSSEPVKLEFMLSTSGQTVPSDDENFFEQAILEKLNIDIELNGVATEYENQLNVRIVSGDVPDVFQIPNRVAVEKYVQSGVLLDFTDYLDELAQVQEFLGDQMRYGTHDGRNVALVKLPGVSYNCIMLRKDWLDKLGLEIPTTPEELLEVAKAFTFDDPDGNGKQDTYGISSTSMATFANEILACYGATMGNTTVVNDAGEVVSMLYSEHMQEGLEMLRAFYDAGVMDPDILSNNDSILRDKVYQGTIGITNWAWSGLLKTEFMTVMHEVDPEAEWIAIEPLTGPAGQYGSPYGFINTYLFGMSSALENEPEKLQAAFDWFNYISSEEGNRLVCYGIEGRHYTLGENGEVVPTDLMGTEAGYIWLYQMTGRPEMEYLQTKFNYVADTIEMCAQAPRFSSYDTAIIIPDGFNKSDMDTYITEEFTKFIYGKRDIAEYPDFLQTLEDTFQISAYLNAAEEQLRGFGVIE